MRPLRWFIAIAIAAGVCWLFPPFHVVSLKKAVAEKAATIFSPAQFAETFWSGQLLPAAELATPAERLLSAISENPTTAKKSFAKGTGAGAGYFYFLRGLGQVLAVTEDEVSLNVTGGTNAEVTLQVGLIFGNALRDGSGLLNVNDYANSQDFNGISEALNRLVEIRVQPKLHEQAKVGAKISFVGCAEIADESTDLKPLKVIPIQNEVQ